MSAEELSGPETARQICDWLEAEANNYRHRLDDDPYGIARVSGDAFRADVLDRAARSLRYIFGIQS